MSVKLSIFSNTKSEIYRQKYNRSNQNVSKICLRLYIQKLSFDKENAKINRYIFTRQYVK